MDEFDAILDRIPCVAGRLRLVEELPGGLTNHNLKVTVPEGSYVVRVSASDQALLAIDRDREHANSRAAAEAGVGAPVVDYLSDIGVLVVGFLPGRTLSSEALREPGILPRIAESCRRLHAGPRFTGDFDMFEVQRRYLSLVQRHGFRLPPRYLEFMPQVDRLRLALAAHEVKTVPCNNDLLAENFIDDGTRIWIIDYEYSGNNDPCFELGNIWSESNLSLDHLEELVTAYYGRPLRDKIARAQLLGLMSKYGWTLWASIQDGANKDISFDFWSWGMEKYERAVTEFDGPAFDRLLDEAATSST